MPALDFPVFKRRIAAPRVKSGYKILLKNKANRPQRPSMLRSALSKQETSVDNLPESGL
ncbi:MAG: hypothetical protein ACTTJV_09195 [Ottowia sp.]